MDSSFDSTCAYKQSIILNYCEGRNLKYGNKMSYVWRTLGK